MSDAGEGAFSVGIKSLARTSDPHPELTVLEDGRPLAKAAKSVRVRYGRPGRFATNQKTLWFSARDRSDPRTNGRTYTLLLPAWRPWLDWTMMLLGVAMMAFALGKAGLVTCWRGAAQVIRPIATVTRPVADLLTLKWMRGKEMPLSYAMARIALGSSLWLLSPMVGPGKDVTDGRAAAYDPVGPFCFLCPSHPSAALVDGCLFILPIAALCLVAGLLSRLSLVVCIFAVWVLASTPWLFGFICHGYTPFVLASLPLLAADCQAWSVDGLLRRLRNKNPKPATGTRPAVLGMQLMAGLVFLSAATHKMFLGNGEFLRWIFSDSLRNVILIQQFVLHRELTPYLNWAVSHEWVWKGLAFAAVSCQTLPFLAIFFIKRPWLRLLGGLALMSEIASLRIVMGIFPQPFILFGLVFFDWEYFRRLVQRKPSDAGASSLASVGAIPLRGYFVGAILGLQAVVGFNWLNVRWLYPFTSFPMFSFIYAPKPYDRHLPFMLQKSTWHVESTPPLDRASLDHLWRSYHEYPWNNTKAPVAAANVIASTIQNWLPKKDDLKELTINAALYQVEPFPSTRINLKYEAGFCRWINGSVRGFRWQYSPDRKKTIDYSAEGFLPADIHLGYVPFDTWTLNHLPINLSATGGSVSLQFKTAWASPPRNGEIEVQFPPGGWLIFVTHDAAGKEDVWGGPVVNPPDPESKADED